MDTIILDNSEIETVIIRISEFPESSRKWADITDKPAVIAAGATIQEALEQIGLENVPADILALQNFANIKSNPIEILLNEAKTIDWQTDLVPNDSLDRTYAEVYGNTINTVTGNWLVETNTYQGYLPEYTYTLSGGLIDTVSFPLLQIGFINFL